MGAILMFLKVYQFRHPDVTANAYKVFSVVCLTLIVEVIGYYSSNSVFWLIFTSAYLMVLTIFTVEIYFHGSFKMVWRSFIKEYNIRQLFKSLPSLIRGDAAAFTTWRDDHRPKFLGKWRRKEGLAHRSILFVAVIIINIALAVFFWNQT